VARRFLCFAVIAFMVAGCAAASDARSSAAQDLALVVTNSAVPASEATPRPTPRPTPIPTAVPTAIPTAVPTPIPTAVPVVVPVVVATPVPFVAPPATCHTSYVGVCLTPGIGDYDCAGGSGNGPNYIMGPFQVVGPDEYGLDSDGDGTGCE
jgi:hypothetical protein